MEEEFLKKLLKEKERYKSYAEEEALKALLLVKEDRVLKETKAIEYNNISLGLKKAHYLAINHVKSK